MFSFHLYFFKIFNFSRMNILYDSITFIIRNIFIMMFLSFKLYLEECEVLLLQILNPIPQILNTKSKWGQLTITSLILFAASFPHFVSVFSAEKKILTFEDFQFLLFPRKSYKLWATKKRIIKLYYKKKIFFK